MTTRIPAQPPKAPVLPAQAGPTLITVAPLPSSSPVVSSKPRPSLPQLGGMNNALDNDFLEMSQSDTTALVEMLSGTLAEIEGEGKPAQGAARERPEVRAACHRMRSFMAAYLIGPRAMKAEDHALLSQFAKLWTHPSTVEKRAQAKQEFLQNAKGANLDFGAGFDNFVASLLRQTGSSGVTMSSRSTPNPRN
jgi:hypothetical protein